MVGSGLGYWRLWGVYTAAVFVYAVYQAAFFDLGFRFFFNILMCSQRFEVFTQRPKVESVRYCESESMSTARDLRIDHGR